MLDPSEHASFAAHSEALDRRTSRSPSPPRILTHENCRLTQKSRTVRPRGVASKARASVRVGAVAAARPTWLPGSPAPAHLDGTLPCDYGFDPLNLGACLLSRNATERRVARARYPIARLDF